ncbi:hypothetical protein PT300_00265 [Enterobacteriaceae bacterium ESL0689]|nr:hypothetical protein [Enterobacteriaceae bacterium ESL0689]
MLLIVRGYQLALKFYLAMIFLTLLLATSSLIYFLIDSLFFAGDK